MIYLLVDLKIVSDSPSFWSKSGLIWRGRLSEGGELTRTGTLTKIWSLMGGGGGGAKPSRGANTRKYGIHILKTY